MTTQDFIGRTLQDRFVITEQLGEGGMGIVFRGLDEVTMDEVAIKVLQPELAAHDEIVARFHREASATRRADHEGTVRILGRGREDDVHFLVMELLKGQSLGAVLTETPVLPPARAARILAQVCGALAAAHARGVVHRDVKPENVMVAPGADGAGEQAKLVDFGVAKLTAPEPLAPSVEDSLITADPTTCGALVGTPEYMAPEQGRGQAVDARTDVYACGVMLYRMMTGRVPFDGDHPLEIIQRHLAEAPPRPRAVAPWIAPDIEAIILKALEKAPSDRYQSATALRAALLGTLDEIEGVKGVEHTERFSRDALGLVARPGPTLEPATRPTSEPATLALPPRARAAAETPRVAAALAPLEAAAPLPRVLVASRRRLAFCAALATGTATLAGALWALLHP